MQGYAANRARTYGLGADRNRRRSQNDNTVLDLLQSVRTIFRWLCFGAVRLDVYANDSASRLEQEIVPSVEPRPFYPS